ncbi:DPY30/SDC1 family protein [Aspergillus chevalieri]|uniref:COMPASS (Complex proteins associated with Set1p) component n=1 Tax=Aspergillus chevalieri TaxID=182096 RepID=A0A7R7VUG7_ASPCH|nr:COMPASS (complex proteins associated with Set1p) component [Aspergillus chevalieri]BCR91016.1 COMPASS (complex proteins associated with Set1p) component [Aspergillus chevalieri]
MANESPLAGTPVANDSLTTPQTQTQAAQAQSQTPGRPGGAPARVYMNEKIVPYLLEGMKGVAKEQPANPLRVLGEFLIQKSAEVEGKSPE